MYIFIFIPFILFLALWYQTDLTVLLFYGAIYYLERCDNLFKITYNIQQNYGVFISKLVSP